MDLRLNREKTHVVDVRSEALDFLGYTFRRDRSRYDPKQRYLNMVPSKASMKRARARLKGLTSHRRSQKPLAEVIGEVNTFLRGWGQHFKLGYPAESFAVINRYAEMRVLQHMNRRSQRTCRKPEGISKQRASRRARPHDTARRRLVNASGKGLQESRMRENRTSGLTRGQVSVSMVAILWHRRETSRKTEKTNGDLPIRTCLYSTAGGSSELKYLVLTLYNPCRKIRIFGLCSSCFPTSARVKTHRNY